MLYPAGTAGVGLGGGVGGGDGKCHHPNVGSQGGSPLPGLRVEHGEGSLCYH
jgi:hypothetical protein